MWAIRLGTCGEVLDALGASASTAPIGRPMTVRWPTDLCRGSVCGTFQP